MTLEDAVGRKVLIRLIGCYGRVLRVEMGPRSGHPELRVQWDKDGSICSARWPLSMLDVVDETEGKPLSWETSSSPKPNA